MKPKILYTNKFITSPRFNDISVLRVIAMLLVVFYHCLCPYSIWDNTEYFIGFHVKAWDVVDGMLAQVHLPIFFIISGYLYGYKRNVGGYSVTSKFVIDKMVRVLSPYVIVGLFLCLIQQRNMEQMLYGISHLWFLLVIFECYLLGRAMERILWIKNSSKVLLMGLAVLFLIVLSYRIPEIKPLAISRLMRYYPYYMIGMLVTKVDFSLFAKYKKVIVASLLFVVVLFLLQQTMLKRMVVTSTLGVATVGLAFCLARCSHIVRLPSWITSLDKCSMGIYIVHHILIQEMNELYVFHELACEYYYIYPMAQFVLITLISWGFVSVCRHVKCSKYVLG